MKGYILLIVLTVLLLMLVILACRLVKKARQLSRTLFGTPSWVKGLEAQSRQLAETPRSVSGMTRIYEPQLKKDFPEFNWKEFRDRAEIALVMSLTAVSLENAEKLKEISRMLYQKVLLWIEENQRLQIHEHYERIRIHKTEITRYEKKKGTCILTLQSAVEYIHYKEKAGILKEGSREYPVQTKYNIELMYIQDAEAANMNQAVGAVCPSCGAPIVSLGEKKCDYCGTAVIPVNIQVWSIHNFYETDDQRG